MRNGNGPGQKDRRALMKLYHHPLSGHSHRARLFVSLLGLPHELVEVDSGPARTRSPNF